MDLADIDLLDPDSFAGGVPHEWFTHLRREAPVFRHPNPHGAPFWVVTRHEDVVALCRDARTFSSLAERGGTRLEASLEAAGRHDGEPARVAAGRAIRGRIMSRMDPPEHTQQRLVVNRGFTPRMVEQLADYVRARTAALLDAAIAAGDVDLVVDVAARLPLDVICELMGVPPEDRDRLFELGNQVMGEDDPDYCGSPEDMLAAMADLAAYGLQLAEARRAEPQDDITTRLVDTRIDGHALSDRDFGAFFMMLAVAGNETTRNAISHGVQALIEHPGEYERLVQHPEILDTAVDEVLRWATPILYFARNVTTDVDLRGHHLREGDKVAMYFASANRDELVFDHPTTFDLSRSPNPHVTFNGGGPHFCLGAHLARLEVRTFLEELVRRAPRIVSLGEPVRLRSNFVAAIKRYPVRFEARRVGSAA